MLLYSEDLFKYVDKTIVPMIVFSGSTGSINYFYVGTFRKRFPYISDIDITNVITCQQNQTMQTRSARLMELVTLDNKNVLFNYLSCGYDTRYVITDPQQDLVRLRDQNLISSKDVDELNSILSAQLTLDGQTTGMQYYLTKYSTLRWTKKEIQNGFKKSFDGLVIVFSEVLAANYTAILHFFIIYRNYYIPADLALVCDNKLMDVNRIIPDVYKYMKYNKEYYFMLKGMKKFFSGKNEYGEISRIIEYKYGIYKQLLIQISHLSYLIEDALISVRIQSRILTTIIADIRKYTKIGDAISDVNELSLLNPNKPGDSTRIVQLLNKLYGVINQKMNTLTKDSYYKYLAKLPEVDKKMFVI
jgi:hypothetical protein